MTKKLKKPWWDVRSIENAGSTLGSGSGLERMVGVSGFAPVAAPEKPVNSPSYNPEPNYQPQTSSVGGIPPKDPPVKKGLSGWQKAVIYAIVPAALASWIG